MAKMDTCGKISFLYFDDLDASCDFFEKTMEMPLVCDQGWSKIYQVCNGAYIGAVDRSRGACKATARDGVLTSLVVKNHEEMVKRLQTAGIEFTYEPHYSESLQIKSLLFMGPEGYMFEVEEFLNPNDRKVFYGEEKERVIDNFSRVVGVMGAFAEVVACGAKQLALGAPVDNKALRDEHMTYAKAIAEKHGIYCCNEDEGFLTDLFPAVMNRHKFNILFYKDEDTLTRYYALKERKAALIASGMYEGQERFQIAYDFGILLSYGDADIRRKIRENTDLE